jgi:hypothetical protein
LKLSWNLSLKEEEFKVRGSLKEEAVRRKKEFKGERSY